MRRRPMMMLRKPTFLAILLCCWATSSAWAQGDPTVPTTPIVDPDPITPPPPPERRVEPRPVVTTVPASLEVVGNGTDVGPRPEGMTVGLGFGYDFPASWESPNTLSARFRLPSGLTFEPIFELGTGSTTTDAGDNENKDAFTSVALLTDVRIPLASRGRGDFIGIAGGGLRYSQSDPDGDDNNSTETSFDIHWGIAIDYWLSRSWAVGMNVTNPLLTYSSTTQEAPGDDPHSSTLAAAIAFSPNVDFKVHLFW